MNEKMKILIAYDGSDCADAALNDLRRAGLPGEAEAIVVTVAETSWLPPLNQSRKPLAGEFAFKGHRLFIIANHFSSKGGDQPLFGRFQPPARASEVQRNQQAQVVNNFVDSILAADSGANVIVLGDLNDFEFSNPLNTLKGDILRDLIETLPRNERYTYVFDGNSQALDHILVTGNLFNSLVKFDVVHMNSEFVDQASDHDPTVAIFRLTVH